MAFWKAAGPYSEGESYRSTDLQRNKKRKRKTFQSRRVALASFVCFGCALQNGGVEARDAQAEEVEERRAGAHDGCCAQDLQRVEACQAVPAFASGASEQRQERSTPARKPGLL